MFLSRDMLMDIGRTCCWRPCSPLARCYGLSSKGSVNRLIDLSDWCRFVKSVGTVITMRAVFLNLTKTT